MPQGIPRIGSRKIYKKGESTDPSGEVLGVISEQTISAESPDLFMSSSGVTVSVGDDPPPPPWETDPTKVRDDTDARSFIRCPNEWVLRWVNPRLLDQVGWRWWEPVLASDPRVTVFNRQMGSVDGNIRRGGRGGDILAWMWRHWYESNQARKQERTERRTRRAVEQFESLQRDRSFGPFVQFGRGHHPSHTLGEGRTMGD